MRVLIYTRRRIKKYYHDLADQAFKNDEKIYFSDDKFCEKIYLMDRFKDKLNKSYTNNYLSENDYFEIKKRCRFLRSKSDSESKKMIQAMWSILDALIEKENIDVGFGLIIDNYVLDVFQRVLKSKNKNYFSLIPIVLNNYSRITTRGEMIKLREVDDEEVYAALNLINKKEYKPWYVKDGAAHIKKSLLSSYIKDKTKLTVFSVLRILENNKYGFYYGSHFINEDRMICNKLSNCNPYKYFNYSWQKKVDTNSEDYVIYIPLQFYPEVSTDYMSNDLYFTDYYGNLLNQLRQLEDDKIKIIIKEHPVALGYRNTDIYKKITSFKNVIFVPHDVPSTQLIEISDCVIAGATSTSIEAYVRGKLVLTNGKSTYDIGNHFEIITEDIIENNNLKEYVINKIASHDKNDEFGLIKDILESSVSFNFNPLIDSRKNIDEIQKIANSIIKYLNKVI